jgi:hypothetical protein
MDGMLAMKARRGHRPEVGSAGAPAGGTPLRGMVQDSGGAVSTKLGRTLSLSCSFFRLG